MKNAIVALVMLAAASPVLANQSTPEWRATPRLDVVRPWHSDAQKKLFELQRDLKAAMPATANRPKVVCGMTIIPADPKIDPKMLFAPKSDSGIEYKLRAIDPPICNPAR
jgi:hypothetical protein